MQLNIKKAVIHVLDRDADEPLLNEFELEAYDDIYSFLEKHIVRAALDEDARKARFREGRNIIKEVCFRMVNDDGYFLEGSKEIARQLFKAMKTNSSISSTDLIISVYENGSEENVAILKMDYSVSFIHDIETVDEKFKITIRKQEISLPGTNQKIQKCAFVRGIFDPAEYDLLVLDNQMSGKKNDEPVAQFFLETFLGADLLIDSKVCTKIFKKETENWIREKSKEGESFVEGVRDHIHNVIREEDEIDINTFSEKVFEDKHYLKEDYIQNMKEKGLVNEKFEVDKEWVEKKLNKIRLKTETGIEVTVNYEDFNDKDKFEIIKNPDGTRNIMIKNIMSIIEK